MTKPVCYIQKNMCRMNSGIIEALLLTQGETSICLSIDTVDLIQAAKLDSWDTFLIAQAAAVIPKDFLSKIELVQDLEQRDPFEGWCE
jgi:hypothetical protein